MIVSDAAFLWWLSPSKKSKMSIGSFQKYWWLKNAAIWLAESILDHNWRTRLFTNMRFLQDHNELINFLAKAKKNNFGWMFEKAFLNFWPLISCKFSEKCQETFLRKTVYCWPNDQLIYWHTDLLRRGRFTGSCRPKYEDPKTTKRSYFSSH